MSHHHVRSTVLGLFSRNMIHKWDFEGDHVNFQFAQGVTVRILKTRLCVLLVDLFTFDNRVACRNFGTIRDIFMHRCDFPTAGQDVDIVNDEERAIRLDDNCCNIV